MFSFLLHFKSMRKDAIYIDTPRPRRMPRARRARTIPVPGQPIEAYQYEKLFRCHYCSDINTTGRDEEDTGNSAMSSVYTMPRVKSLGIRASIEKGLQIKSINKSVFTSRTAPMAGATGTRAVKNVWTVVAHTGCKSCGTINWTGRK